jgi:hypothetical protein
MNKMFKILEIGWLVMGCIGILMCSYSIVTKDIQGAKYFLGFTVVCGILYAMRKRQRVKFEQQNRKE